MQMNLQDEPFFYLQIVFLESKNANASIRICLTWTFWLKKKYPSLERIDRGKGGSGEGGIQGKI
jgi:hypothetical protein